MNHLSSPQPGARLAGPPAESRPRLHFTPPAGWLNDPNGLLYHDGEYHLFYQHHPHSLVWGPMHWGHAVSRDLVRWEHLPIALEPDELGLIFSGSAVVDAANTAGFGAGALVAVFTHDQAGRQAQSLAFSTDRGRSWTKHAGNPVLAPADSPADFRDPRVFWYGAPGQGHWVMALACGQEVWFYRSPDLRRWTKASTFGAGHGAHGGVWECPELLCLPVDGGPERRWLLAVSVQQGAPAGGSGTQYFVGSFDGATFTSDDPPETVRWADYGADFYAAQAWHDAPGGRALWLAWMNNWDYARDTPATGWRGMMSAARELALVRDGPRLRLAQRPAPELTAGWPARVAHRDLAIPPAGLGLAELRGPALLEATLQVEGRAGLRLRAAGAAPLSLTYDRALGSLALDAPPGWRSPALGAARQLAPLSPRDGLVRLQILVDLASIEVFADGGLATLSSQIFPGGGPVALEAFAEGGAATLVALSLWAPEPSSGEQRP